MKKILNDRGDSLLEVVISTVIMGIIGVLLVSSIASARPFADKMSLMGQTVQNLNSLSQSINLQTFAPCSQKNPQPYVFGQVPTSNSTSGNGLEILTTELPAVMVSTSAKSSAYSYQLVAGNVNGILAWSVEPALPAGLTLNPSTGVISGTTSQATTSQYTFSVSIGNAKATKNLVLSSAAAQILVKVGSQWTPCENVPSTEIRSASGDGLVSTYTYQGNPISAGDVITIWGSSNPIFDGNSLKVATATGNTFTVASTAIGNSAGGSANLSSVANVQQVVVSTVVSGSPLQKVITKALQ
jgi:type II secretory pathway pseudopilin PulG